MSLEVSVSRLRQWFIDFYVLSFQFFRDGYRDEKVGSILELANMKGHLTNRRRQDVEDQTSKRQRRCQ